jgi:hypothetical protein
MEEPCSMTEKSVTIQSDTKASSREIAHILLKVEVCASFRGVS